MTFEALAQEIWPRSASENSINGHNVFVRYDARISEYEQSPLSSKELEAETYDLAKELFEQDAERRASIFSRAQAILPAIGIAVTLVSTIGFGLLVKRADLAAMAPAAQAALIACYLVTLLFLCRAGLVILRVQGKQQITILGPLDTVPRSGVNCEQHRRAITLARLNAVTANYRVTNRLMEMLSVAQRALRNATVAVALGGVVPVVAWFLSAHGSAASSGSPF